MEALRPVGSYQETNPSVGDGLVHAGVGPRPRFGRLSRHDDLSASYLLLGSSVYFHLEPDVFDQLRSESLCVAWSSAGRHMVGASLPRSACHLARMVVAQLGRLTGSWEADLAGERQES